MNTLFVVLPIGLLLWTTYLTHSRGGLIALAAISLFAARKFIGTTPSMILSAVLVIAMLALDFTGGRGISASDGADRLEAWASGLEMFKSAPLFGIGFGNFTDYHEVTAHNSFVLCLAELGLIGSTLWIGLLVTTVLGLRRVLRMHEPAKAEKSYGLAALFETRRARYAVAPPPALAFEGAAASLQEVSLVAASSVCVASVETEVAHPDDLNQSGHHQDLPATEAREPIVPGHWVTAIYLALISFMTTGWFLSRSYAVPAYLVMGLATAVIGLEHCEDDIRLKEHWILTTIGVQVFLVALIYCVVRLRH
jgi:O-antigen ligase